MATRMLYCHCHRDKQREILVINRSLMRSREGSHQQNGMISMCVCVHDATTSLLAILQKYQCWYQVLGLVD